MTYYVLPFSKEGIQQIKHGLGLLKEDVLHCREKLIDNWSEYREAVYPSYILGLTVPTCVDYKLFENIFTDNILLNTMSVAIPVTFLVHEFFKEEIYTNPETRREKGLSLLERGLKKIF